MTVTHTSLTNLGSGFSICSMQCPNEGGILLLPPLTGQVQPTAPVQPHMRNRYIFSSFYLKLQFLGCISHVIRVEEPPFWMHAQNTEQSHYHRKFWIRLLRPPAHISPHCSLSPTPFLLPAIPLYNLTDSWLCSVRKRAGLISMGLQLPRGQAWNLPWLPAETTDRAAC